MMEVDNVVAIVRGDHIVEVHFADNPQALAAGTGASPEVDLMTTPPDLPGPGESHHDIFLGLGTLLAIPVSGASRLRIAHLAVRHHLLETEAIIGPDDISVLVHFDTPILDWHGVSVAKWPLPHSAAHHMGGASKFTDPGRTGAHRYADLYAWKHLP